MSKAASNMPLEKWLGGPCIFNRTDTHYNELICLFSQYPRRVNGASFNLVQDPLT